MQEICSGPLGWVPPFLQWMFIGMMAESINRYRK